jgi:hypothetical protein
LTVRAAESIIRLASACGWRRRSGAVSAFEVKIMYVKTTPADSGQASSSNSQPSEFIVKRDKARPYSFAGVCLAWATQPAGLGSVFELRAAVYRTVGGRFICTLSRVAVVQNALAGKSPAQDAAEFDKADVFTSLDDAMTFFRPGPLTDTIRKALGLDDPIRID